MNNYFENNKKSIIIKFIKKLAFITMVLSFCAGLSFLITDRLTNTKYNDEDATVFTSSTVLGDTSIITLKDNNEIVKEISIKEFKEQNDVSIEINKKFLLDYYKIQGYKFQDAKDGKVYFKKESDLKVLEPNKYYIGEKNGFLAIYKSDERGKAFIEEDSDIKKDKILVDSLPEQDIDRIKNFKIICSTKSEAEERISAFY